MRLDNEQAKVLLETKDVLVWLDGVPVSLATLVAADEEAGTIEVFADDTADTITVHGAVTIKIAERLGVNVAEHVRATEGQ